MSVYEDAPEPYGDDVLTAEQAFARARRALEVAELNLDRIVGNTGGAVPTIAFIAARAEIGRGWAELGAALRRAER